MRAEHREEGSVGWGIYGQYCRYIGLPDTIIVLLLLLCGHVSS